MNHLPFPTQILRQKASSDEARAVVHAALLLDIPVRVRDLQDASALAPGDLPVGSVEFVRAAMLASRIAEPPPLSYPAAAQAFLGRKVEASTAGQVRQLVEPAFVKPQATKLFTGFVYQPGLAAGDYSPDDREHLQAFLALPNHTPVWISEVAHFRAEWRVYVQGGRIIGQARYDDQDDDAHKAADSLTLGDEPISTGNQPDPQVVSDIILAMENACSLAAYGVDVGIDAAGKTLLVEINDAWALGLYAGALSPRGYLEFLWKRWRQIACSGSVLDHPAEGVFGAR